MYALVSAAALAGACRSGDAAPPPPAVEAPGPAAPGRPAVERADAGVRGAGSEGSSRGEEDAGALGDVGALIERLSGSPVVGARPVSPRSLSVKIALASGDRAAFKPLRKTSRSARWEVAFYALSPLVGARRVPPSTLRRVPLAQLVALLHPSYPELAASLRAEADVDDRGLVGGAVIAWIDDLAPTRFDGAGGRALLERWLAPDGPSAADEPLAAEASRMIVADHVLGNWDRFSGGNLFESRSGRALWLIDNNGSFAPWSDRQRERMDGQLLACARFSREQVARLRALTAGAVRGAVRGEEAKGIAARLLDDAEVATLLERRDAVVRRVDALVAERGSAAVLAFP
jgi:hypothetical protein